MNQVVNFFQNKTGPVTRALLALILVLVLGLIFNANGAFLKVGTHRDTLRQIAVPGVLAIGMTLVIITGGIDLSVGSVLAVAAVCFSLFTIHWQWSAWLTIPLVLLIGAACGGVSGGLVAKLRIQPFIATLAMMVFARGLAKAISGGIKIDTTIRLKEGTHKVVELPESFHLIASRIYEFVPILRGHSLPEKSHVFGGELHIVTIIFLVGLAIAWLLLAKHRWGRSLYAIGGNEEAARLSGVSVTLSKIFAYAMCGFFAAVAGICEAAQTQYGNPEAGATGELTAISMVVIGGTSLSGGRGGMALTLLGVLIIGYVDKILSLNSVQPAMRLMLTGSIIIVAVLAQRKK